MIDGVTVHGESIVQISVHTRVESLGHKICITSAFLEILKQFSKATVPSECPLQEFELLPPHPNLGPGNLFFIDVQGQFSRVSLCVSTLHVFIAI